MTQADEWRELLEQANDVPGRMTVRPGAGALLRTRARRQTHRRTAVALTAALLLTVGGGFVAVERDAGTGTRVPIGQPTDPAPAPGAIVGKLATPIEMRLVEQSGTCPLTGGVPSWDGSECYRLGPVQLRVLAVTRATFDQSAHSPTATAPATAQGTATVELTAHDRTAFADLTGRHIGQRIAVVVDNRALSAPQIAERIDTGTLLVSGNGSMIAWTAARLKP